MPRVCTVCQHPQREAIDRALVAGGTLKKMAALYSVSEYALARHRDNHLPEALAQAQEAAEIAHGDDLLEQVEQLLRWAKSITVQTGNAKDHKTALSGIRTALACVELSAELTGKLAREGTVNVLVLPQWIEVRAVLVSALAPYPEARAAVAAALEGIEHAGK